MKTYSPSDFRQEQITNAIVIFIAGDMLPLSIVESEHLRNSIKTVDPKYQIPSHKQVSSKLLHETSKVVQNNLPVQLKKKQRVYA